MSDLLTGMPVLSLVPSHHNLTYHLIVIVIAAFAAFIPRYFPMRFFTNRKIPLWFNEWMKYVPVSLFTALVVKSIFMGKTYTFVPFGHVSQILAAVIVMIVAYFTRSMAVSVIGGLAAVWLISLVI